MISQTSRVMQSNCGLQVIPANPKELEPFSLPSCGLLLHIPQGRVEGTAFPGILVMFLEVGGWSVYLGFILC